MCSSSALNLQRPKEQEMRKPWEVVEDMSKQMDELKMNARQYVDDGNKSAGRRARRISLELTKTMKEFRAVSTAYDKKAKA